jgi:hypothetical protein
MYLTAQQQTATLTVNKKADQQCQLFHHYMQPLAQG